VAEDEENSCKDQIARRGPLRYTEVAEDEENSCKVQTARRGPLRYTEVAEDTDYTVLDQSINRLMNPDPPSAAMNAGYFQLGMNSAISYLTKFLVLKCKIWNLIIKGLEWTVKIMGDTIIWAQKEEELMGRIRRILHQCRDTSIEKKNEVATHKEMYRKIPEALDKSRVRHADTKPNIVETPKT
jgi:hypothetical protein